jgi:hypothetical protein
VSSQMTLPNSFSVTGTLLAPSFEAHSTICTQLFPIVTIDAIGLNMHKSNKDAMIF